MELHKNPEMFSDAILAASEYLNIAPALIEKDYYVTLILKRLNEEIPGLLFKGGTSLSKCYKLIDRFSEDIDLTLDSTHFTQSQKRNANKSIIRVCEELGFQIENKAEVAKHSHGNYNCYNIEYPIHFSSVDVKPYLKVEMVFIQKAYPDDIQTANSFIETWLMETGNINTVQEFGLEPFPIKVQSLERTFVDKVFALCDYALQNETVRQSRHIYDIAKLLTRTELDSSLLPLIESVRADRKSNKTCLSAQDGVNIPDLLQKIMDKEIFRKDYEDSTSKLLTRPCSYDEAINALHKIVDSCLFELDYPGVYVPPDELLEYFKKKHREHIMKGRGPESLTGLGDIEVFEKTKAACAKRASFERLYYGEQIFNDEEKNAFQLMQYLACFCEDDKEKLLRVFKSSGQYCKNKPIEYYEKLASDALEKISEIKKTIPTKEIIHTFNRNNNSNHNSK